MILRAISSYSCESFLCARHRCAGCGLAEKPGASRQLLLGALDHRFELLLSVPLILEYEAVLTRPEHLETAVNGNADAIVTFNQRDFEDVGENFDCAVILPGAALQQMRSSNP